MYADVFRPEVDRRHTPLPDQLVEETGFDTQPLGRFRHGEKRFGIGGLRCWCRHRLRQQWRLERNQLAQEHARGRRREGLDSGGVGDELGQRRNGG